MTGSTYSPMIACIRLPFPPRNRSLHVRRLLVSILTVGSLLLLGACEQKNEQPSIQMHVPFQKEGTLAFMRPDSTRIATIDVEIAETDEERSRGLMQRRSLPSRGGMLFLFAEADTQSFWMRNTPLPLDIIFVDADGQIVNIARRTRPFSEDRIRSSGPAKYVVEVRAGFTERHGITDDAWIRWQREPEG